MIPETVVNTVPKNAIDYLENAPEATVAICVLILVYRIGMRLCDIIEKKDK